MTLISHACYRAPGMRRLGAVLVALVLSGCASRGTTQRLDSDLAGLRIDVAGLQEGQVRTTRDSAKAAAELQSLEVQLKELEAGVRRMTEALAQLRTRLDATDTAIRDARAEIATLPARLVPPVPLLVPEPEKERAATVGNAEEAYAKALASFNAREHGQAVLDFLDFVARYPKHPLAPQAQYWIGEAYFLQHDWRQALVELEKVVERGGTPKVPDALLKVGLCYTNLRDPDRARQAWQRLRNEYPSTDAAARARALLSTRGASSHP